MIQGLGLSNFISGPLVQSLIWELGSHKPHGVAKKKKEKKPGSLWCLWKGGIHWGPEEPVAVLAHQWPFPKEGAVPWVSTFSSPDPSPCCPQRVPSLCPNWFPLICDGLGRQTSHICWKGVSKKKLARDSVLTGEL